MKLVIMAAMSVGNLDKLFGYLACSHLPHDKAIHLDRVPVDYGMMNKAKNKANYNRGIFLDTHQTASPDNLNTGQSENFAGLGKHLDVHTVINPACVHNLP